MDVSVLHHATAALLPWKEPSEPVELRGLQIWSGRFGEEVILFLLPVIPAYTHTHTLARAHVRTEYRVSCTFICFV
jgi:hypothetical protein